MKLTRDNLNKAMVNADILSVDVMYNWDDPDNITPSEYNSIVATHSMLFNNSKDGPDHFFEQDQTKINGIVLNCLNYLKDVVVKTTRKANRNNNNNNTRKT